MDTKDIQFSRPLVIALTLYITALLAANTLGLKIMPFLFGTHLSVSIFWMPVIFIMTDVVGEVYGKRMAKFFVLAGFLSNVLFIVFSGLSLAMPWSPDGLWAQVGYDQIFGLSTRITIASLVAFAVAEYQDVFTFFFFRAKIGEKMFWLRSLLSNVWSQLLDSVLFMIIAFAGVYPTHVLISIIVSWWAYKVVMGFAFTPLSYLGIRLLRGKQINESHAN